MNFQFCHLAWIDFCNNRNHQLNSLLYLASLLSIIEWIGEDSDSVYTQWNIIKESEVRFGKIEVGAVVDVEWEDETSPAKIVKISGMY